jgi:hypothetical protein
MEAQNDVEQVPSPATEAQDTGVTQDVVAEHQEGSEQTINIDPSFPVESGKKLDDGEELDERGVPYKNRYHEYRRKYDETTEKLGNIEKTLQELAAQKQQQQEPEYTIADLEAWKQQHPEHSAWCEQEKAKLMQKEIIGSVRQEFEQREAFRQAELVKQQSLAAVAQNFPDAFKRDSVGNIVGWDETNQITKLIAKYGNDPAIASRPDGLLYAAKLAAGDLYARGLQKAGTTLAQKQAQLGSLQRKTAIEGAGGGAPQAVPERVKALGELRQTGSRDAARSALKNMFKDSGKFE